MTESDNQEFDIENDNAFDGAINFAVGMSVTGLCILKNDSILVMIQIVLSSCLTFYLIYLFMYGFKVGKVKRFFIAIPIWSLFFYYIYLNW